MLKFHKSNLGLNLIGCLKLHTVDAAEKLVWHERKRKTHSIMNAASFTLHRALTPKLDTVPSEHTLLVVFFHLFTRHAKGLLGGPVL